MLAVDQVVDTPRSSDHVPAVHARVLYDEERIYVHFRVQDRYVRSCALNFMDSVCRDSCVEFFVQPKGDGAYFNFEINAGGTLHLSCIRDGTRTGRGFADWEPVDPALAVLVPIHSSLPRTVEPERVGPVAWRLAFSCPWTLFERYLGPLGPRSGSEWRANFYKCADATSHPHWLTWAPVGELNFHRPQDFAPLVFE